MKKLINAPDDLVDEALEGMALAHAELLRVNAAPRFVTRAEAKGKGKVALLSGGGSGHEPLHAGFVGRGMLDAACPGAVFTSPTPDQIFEATRAVDGDAGVLHIIKNYTGDVMNFEMAAELAREAGIPVEGVLVNDDVAVEDSLYTAGRRGVGTTVLVEKICGGAAEAGRPLEEVAALGRRVNARGRSMGVALSACTVPHAGKPSFELGPGEMEVGIGIHGEPGRRRAKLEPADRVAEILMQPILDDLPFEPGDDVLLFVNGMGGTPLLELYVVYRKARAIAQGRGLNVARSLVGSYVTSLEMAGASATLLKLDDEMLRWWDAPVHTPALRWGT
ncbi:Glycerone kinase, DAK1 domain [Sorangium cellulosum So ce56]|uniref:phosphoenolpyruvate--glycerone phosphotransferase n=1 Tax=Sorangium cellulosum (strain So ce56) TaxID=448385 RepID=A9G644_SORC5|nr:dihydroxyacetone kinase subunit DhaK [Sorangium cellulosum]CAN92650.1 Glycerone kinase, DAK1 domain [Sorangium cellulosum So ce56]